MYRDDQAAAAERIESLEGELSACRQRIGELEGALTARGDELELVVHRAERRRTRSLRHWRWGAAVLFGICVALAWLLARAPALPVVEAQELTIPPRAQLLADPSDRAVSAERPDEELADATAPDDLYDPLRNDPWNESAPPRDDAALKRRLLRKMKAGDASFSDLRFLERLCATEGDWACADRASVAAWRAELAEERSSWDRSFGLDAQKPGLLAKMAEGTASQAELRLLMSICSAQGHEACRDQAFAMWKANREAAR